MATSQMDLPPDEPESGWAIGGIVFAATIMVLIGVFQIDRRARRDRRTTTSTSSRPNYTYDIDTTGWGWIHLILGIVVAARRLRPLRTRKIWAGVVAIALALPQRDRQLLLHPLLPVLVDPDDRPARCS